MLDKPSAVAQSRHCLLVGVYELDFNRQKLGNCSSSEHANLEFRTQSFVFAENPIEELSRLRSSVHLRTQPKLTCQQFWTSNPESLAQCRELYRERVRL